LPLSYWAEELKLLAWMMLQSHGKDLNNWKTFLSDLEQE
jgi:hypothetical protein